MRQASASQPTTLYYDRQLFTLAAEEGALTAEAYADADDQQTVLTLTVSTTASGRYVGVTVTPPTGPTGFWVVTLREAGGEKILTDKVYFSE